MALVTEVTLLDDILFKNTQIFGTAVSIRDEIGEVQANPTQYTVLERLKNIETNTGGGSSNFTALNSTNVDASKINLDDIVTNTDNIHQEIYFEKSFEITRPANTTAYSIDDIINGNGVNTMNSWSFASEGAVAGDIIDLISIGIYSSNGNVATKLVADLQIYPGNSLGGQSFSDNGAWNPSYASVTTNSAYLPVFYLPTQTINTGSGFYKIQSSTVSNSRLILASDTLYFALLCLNAYAPANAEKFTISITGTLKKQ